MVPVIALALSLLAPLQTAAPAQQVSAVDHVVVVGASMAAGFGAPRSLGETLEASIRATHEPVLGLGDILFFTSPLAIGARQIEAALDFEPTLVVGIDFLFWFGYGTFDAKGGEIESEAERLELLEAGLALLEEIECPLVLGDFPDMSAAVGKMLSPAQMPQKTTLPLLSKRVREWAAARKDTLVLPLSELVVRLGSKTEIQMGRLEFPAGSRLLQEDQLHPTLEGLVAVSLLLGDELVKKGIAKEADFEFDYGRVLGGLRGTAVGAGSPK